MDLRQLLVIGGDPKRASGFIFHRRWQLGGQALSITIWSSG
jgi:hypothetical protein